MEEILECSQHDCVVENQNMRTDGEENSCNEGIKRHLNVVERNVKEHFDLCAAVINSERISFFDVFQSHFNVSVSHNHTREIRIEMCGNCSHKCPENENKQRKQEIFAGSVNFQRN
ncbi:hypothetical protein D3C85_1250780 [compost metagenome]